VLEGRKGEGKRGLNLTAEVRDGIKNHTGDMLPVTLEGQIVKISDRIAYINHDIDDAIRSGIIDFADLPQDCIEILGSTHSARINALILDLIQNSDNKDLISLSSDFAANMNKLRTFMFENVYHNSKVKKNEDVLKVSAIIEDLYAFYVEHPARLPGELRTMIPEFGLHEMVKDYVAGMTDRYAFYSHNEL
jgi:dGTPase